MRARNGDVVVGVGFPVPTLGGRSVPFVNLDNAGATPAFRSVVDAVQELLPYVANVQGGSGFASRVCVEAVAEARATLAEFVGADPDRDTVVFVDTMADALSMVDGAVVVSGASGVTGVIEHVHDLAARAHANSRRIVVDATHLAGHRPLDVLSHRDQRHLDFVAISAPHMYSPFGCAALIGRRDHLAAEPDTTNVVGIVALATAACTLRDLGCDRVARHEAALLTQATERLVNVPGVHLHAPSPKDADRVGIVPFTLDGVDASLVAAILDHEHGIGVHSNREIVRASFGCYSDPRDVHRLVGALHRIAAGEIDGDYWCDRDGNWRTGGDVSSVA
jgi:selenocysteine lyase/cysteine desulfurase